jgi:C1A family cysteine protease
MSEAKCNLNSCVQRFQGGLISLDLNFDGIDLRDEIAKRGIAIRNQGGRGTCSVQAMTFLLEYAYTSMCGNSYNSLSVEYLNHMANVVSGRRDDGDFFHNILDGYNENGIIFNSALPYNRTMKYVYSTMDNTINNNNLTNSGRGLINSMFFKAKFIKPFGEPTGLSNSQFNLVLRYLDRGIPVAIGRAHSKVLVGYRRDKRDPSKGTFVFRNSYGVGTGDQGYDEESFQKVINEASDAIVFEIPKAFGYYPVVQ